MNLFVAGGTGYRGSAVTAALRADGQTARAHVRSIASAWPASRARRARSR